MHPVVIIVFVVIIVIIIIFKAGVLSAVLVFVRNSSKLIWIRLRGCWNPGLIWVRNICLYFQNCNNDMRKTWLEPQVVERIDWNSSFLLFPFSSFFFFFSFEIVYYADTAVPRLIINKSHPYTIKKIYI